MLSSSTQKLLDLNDYPTSSVKIGVVGVGGAGGHILEHISNPDQKTLFYIDTDARSLAAHHSHAQTVWIGQSLTRGLSCGGDQQLGQQAAVTESERFEELFNGLDIIIFFAGLAGGTGGGAIHTLVEVATKKKAIVLIFGIFPFDFEGPLQLEKAQAKLKALRAQGQAIIALSNAKLIEYEKGLSVMDAFKKMNLWVNQFLDCFWHALNQTGYINIDLQTLKHFFKGHKGPSLLAMGMAHGPSAIDHVFTHLCLSPLLHLPHSTPKADRLLIFVRSSDQFKMDNLKSLAESIHQQFSTGQDLQLSLIIEPNWQDQLEICILGIEQPTPKLSTTYAKPTVASTARKLRSKDQSKQEEFNFEDQALHSSFFQSTQPYSINGQNLDIPTYLRQNIKLEMLVS